jgi:shikimate kinase
MSNKVISCGGGAVLNKGNMDHLREHSVVVWLWAKADTILQRIGDNGERPLLNVRDKRSEVEKLLRFRKPFYAYASDFLIRTDKKKPKEIAERIYDESSKFLKS